MKSLFKQGVSGIVLLISGVFSCIGGVIYTISGTQGYLYGTPFNSLPLVFALVAAVLAVVVALFGDRFQTLAPYLTIVAGALIVGSICFFILERVNITQEILIPNEHPAELYAAFYLPLPAVSSFCSPSLAPRSRRSSELRRRRKTRKQRRS